MALILDARDISYHYPPGPLVLSEVSVAVASRSIVFLLGRNGSGKTTLLEILSGIRAPDSGIVRLAGDDLHRLSARQRARRVGLVPQMHTPVFSYTVRQVVTMGRAPYLGLFGAPGRRDDAIVTAALDAVGLAALAERPYTEISGGEKQLTLIARGLAQQTDVLLLDEPTAHLDPRNQALVMDAVAELAQNRVSFIISSHNPNSALLYADRVIILKQGRVIANGTPAEVITEAVLTESYDMAVDVIYGADETARAVMPRRNGTPGGARKPGNGGPHAATTLVRSIDHDAPADESQADTKTGPDRPENA